MKLNYCPDTDSMYVDRSDLPGVESWEIAEGVVVDHDASGDLVGIDINNAGRKVEVKKLILSKLPGQVKAVAPTQ
jgi:uncharacterized protein YuzE